jgi:hypothetical protein
VSRESRVWTVKNTARITRDRRAWGPLRLKLRPDAASYWIERAGRERAADEMKKQF